MKKEVKKIIRESFTKVENNKEVYKSIIELNYDMKNAYYFKNKILKPSNKLIEDVERIVKSDFDKIKDLININASIDYSEYIVSEFMTYL